MDCRIIKKDRFFIIGLRSHVQLRFTGENEEIFELEKRMTPEIKESLLELNDTEPKGLISVSASFEDRTREGSFLDQYIGVASSGPDHGNLSILTVDPSDWAVFRAAGSYPEALQSTWARIYSEWLGKSSYELTGGPEMLSNEDTDRKKPDFTSYIWIPVRKIR